MRCWGRTSLKHRCKNNCKYFLCHHHWYQPFMLLFTLATVYITSVSVIKSIWGEEIATKDDTKSIEDLINKRFNAFVIPDIESDLEYPGVTASIVFNLAEQSISRRKYIFDLADQPDRDRLSLYLDADNILIFQIVDNKGEIYNIKIPPKEYSFNKFMFLNCEYGTTEEFSFLRLFINNKLIEQRKFKFKISLPEDFKDHSTIMADIYGKNNTTMTVAFYSLSHVVFGKIKRSGFYNSIQKYLSDIHHPFIIDEQSK